MGFFDDLILYIVGVVVSLVVIVAAILLTGFIVYQCFGLLNDVASDD